MLFLLLTIGYGLLMGAPAVSSNVQYFTIVGSTYPGGMSFQQLPTLPDIPGAYDSYQHNKNLPYVPMGNSYSSAPQVGGTSPHRSKQSLRKVPGLLGTFGPPHKGEQSSSVVPGLITSGTWENTNNFQSGADSGHTHVPGLLSLMGPPHPTEKKSKFRGELSLQEPYVSKNGEQSNSINFPSELQYMPGMFAYPAGAQYPVLPSGLPSGPFDSGFLGNIPIPSEVPSGPLVTFAPGAMPLNFPTRITETLEGPIREAPIDVPNNSKYLSSPFEPNEAGKKQEDLRPMPGFLDLIKQEKNPFSDYNLKFSDVYLPESQLPLKMPNLKKNHIYLEHHHRVEFANSDQRSNGEKTLVGCFPGNYVQNPDKSLFHEESLMMPFSETVPAHLRHLKCIYLTHKPVNSGETITSPKINPVEQAGMTFWKPDKNARGDFSEIFNTESPLLKSENVTDAERAEASSVGPQEENTTLASTKKDVTDKPRKSGTPKPKTQKIEKTSVKSFRKNKKTTVKPGTFLESPFEQQTQPVPPSRKNKKSTEKPGTDLGSPSEHQTQPVPLSRKNKKSTVKPGTFLGPPLEYQTQPIPSTSVKPDKKVKKYGKKSTKRSGKKPERVTEEAPAEILLRTIRKIMATTPKKHENNKKRSVKKGKNNKEKNLRKERDGKKKNMRKQQYGKKKNVKKQNNRKQKKAKKQNKNKKKKMAKTELLWDDGTQYYKP